MENVGRANSLPGHFALKTTNFFIDFIVVGVIGIMAFFLPILMADYGVLSWLISNSGTIIKLTPILTVGTYAFGVLYNQISDRTDDLLAKCIPVPYLRAVEDARKDLFQNTGYSDHDCIQYIVIQSPPAYEYLSFRRSVLRIIRAMLAMCLAVPLLHFLLVIFFVVRGDRVRWSTENLLVIGILLLFGTFCVYTLRKLAIGYFSAVRSFYVFLRTEKAAATSSSGR